MWVKIGERKVYFGKELLDFMFKVMGEGKGKIKIMKLYRS